MGFDFSDGGGSKSEANQIGISDSFGSSSSNSSSQSSSSSRPSSPRELADYYQRLNSLTGGRVDAVAGSPLEPLGPDAIRALGGLDAMRELKAMEARQRAIDEIEADPSLSLFQRQRARQLTDEDLSATQDAIAKETGAQITALARRNALDKVESDLAQLEALADIFFGGKGQHSKSSSSSTSSSSSHQESHSTQFGESTSTADGGDSFGLKIL